MQVIILGDVHLGKSTCIGRAGAGTSLNSRIVDQLNLLDWTLEKAIEKDINDIIITGDIFEDPKPHTSIITLFISWLKKCEVNNVNVHIIMGNHDMLRTGTFIYSPLDIISEVELDCVNIYKYINTIIIGNSAFTFVPYTDRKSLLCSGNSEAIDILKNSLVYELATIPITYHKVLVGHVAIEGSIPVGDEIDDLSDALMCPTSMFEGYDYVWMGHVHKPQIMKKKPFISHIGSMDISNFAETDQEKYIVVFDCFSGKFENITLPTRPLHKIAISVPADKDDTTEYVISEIKKIESKLNKSIVRVEVTLPSPSMKSINKNLIEKFLYNSGVFNIAGISEIKKAALIKKTVQDQEIDFKMDINSAIKAYCTLHVPKEQQDEFIETCKEMYNKYQLELK